MFNNSLRNSSEKFLDLIKINDYEESVTFRLKMKSERQHLI